MKQTYILVKNLTAMSDKTLTTNKVGGTKQYKT